MRGSVGSPKIEHGLKCVVTGFPKSGSSFVCSILSAVGLHPGSATFLKGNYTEANHRTGQHKQGHYEYLPIRDLLTGNHDMQEILPNGWAAVLDWAFNLEFLSRPAVEPIPQLQEVIQLIVSIGELDFYRDGAFPIFHRYFPDIPVIVVTRDLAGLLEANQEWEPKLELFPDDLNKCLQLYQHLVNQAIEGRRHLHLAYEDFATDWYETVKSITTFLNLDVPDSFICYLERTWRPLG